MRFLTQTTAWQLLLLMLGVGFWTASAKAEFIVFDNGVGGAGGIANAYLSDDDRPLSQFDDFSSATATSVDRIRWTGAYAFQNTPPANDDFRVEIRQARNNGNPGAVLYSHTIGNANRVDSGVDIFGFDVFSYEADIPEFSLTAGTTYWLGVINNTTGEFDNWYWGTQTGGNSRGTSNGSSYTAFNQRHDFTLVQTPEPSSAAVTLLTLGWLTFRRKRRA